MGAVCRKNGVNVGDNAAETGASERIGVSVSFPR